MRVPDKIHKDGNGAVFHRYRFINEPLNDFISCLLFQGLMKIIISVRLARKAVSFYIIF